MSIREDLKVLHQTPIFKGVSETALQIMSFSAEHIQVEPGEFIFYEGEIGGAGYLILDGKFKIIRRKENNTTYTDAKEIVESAAFLGELSMIINSPYVFSAKAEEKSRIMKITNELFFKISKEFPEIAQQTMKVMEQKLSGTLNMFEQIKHRFL